MAKSASVWKQGHFHRKAKMHRNVRGTTIKVLLYGCGYDESGRKPLYVYRVSTCVAVYVKRCTRLSSKMVRFRTAWLYLKDNSFTIFEEPIRWHNIV